MKAQAFALSIALCAAHAAQASQPIYRCVGANGEVAFVPTPCDETSQPLRVRGHPNTPTSPTDATSQQGSIATAQQSTMSGEQRMAEEGNIRIRSSAA